MNIFRLDMSKSLREANFSTHQDDALVLSAMAKIIIEDDKFRELLTDTLTFILSELGDDLEIKSLENMLKKLNIKLNG